MNDFEPAAWWPPKPGDKLRKFTHHGAGGMRIRHVHALVHVLAVFEHDGETLATVAEWFPTKRRWNYETIAAYRSSTGFCEFWPDGQDPTKKHGIPGQLCECCK